MIGDGDNGEWNEGTEAADGGRVPGGLTAASVGFVHRGRQSTSMKC